MAFREAEILCVHLIATKITDRSVDVIIFLLQQRKFSLKKLNLNILISDYFVELVDLSNQLSSVPFHPIKCLRYLGCIWW